MCRVRTPVFAALSILHARLIICYEVPTTIAEDDECASVSLLQADAVVKSKKATRSEDPPEVPNSGCQWMHSDFVAGEVTSEPLAKSEGSIDSVSDALHELPEAPAQPAPSQADGDSLVWQFRCLLCLMTLAVVVDGAKKWGSQRSGGDAECAVAPQPKQTVTAPAAPPAPAPRPARHCELFDAALEGDAARCKALLDLEEAHARGSALEMLVRADSWGSTAVHAAARGGSEQVLELLLQRRAQVDAIDSWDETPLHLAAREGHADACALLVSKGASLSALNAQDRTPLVVAAHASQEAVCDRLLDLSGTSPAAVGPAEEDLPPFLAELASKRPKQEDLPPLLADLAAKFLQEQTLADESCEAEE